MTIMWQLSDSLDCRVREAANISKNVFSWSLRKSKFSSFIFIQMVINPLIFRIVWLPVSYSHLLLIIRLYTNITTTVPVTVLPIIQQLLQKHTTILLLPPPFQVIYYLRQDDVSEAYSLIKVSARSKSLFHPIIMRYCGAF